MIIEKPKTWEETLTHLEEILEKGEFVTVPDHLTFEEFDEWLKEMTNEV